MNYYVYEWIATSLQEPFLFRIPAVIYLSCLTLMQVIIGSPDLKANHAIRQHVDIVSESQKYNKYYTFKLLWVEFFPLITYTS